MSPLDGLEAEHIARGAIVFGGALAVYILIFITSIFAYAGTVQSTALAATIFIVGLYGIYTGGSNLWELFG